MNVRCTQELGNFMRLMPTGKLVDFERPAMGTSIPSLENAAEVDHCWQEKMRK
jgi:hypothetical protein